MKSKKSALLKSLIALLLCLSMLVGTTFAWFTDSVSTGINTIAAGNLDVELYHTNAAVQDKKVDDSTDLFLDLQGEDILWEPGVVSYENLRICNEGDLALAYQMSIATANENHIVDPSGAIYGLSQILKVGVVEGGINATDRAGVVASVGEGNWITLGEFLRSGSLLPEGAGEAEDTWGVVIYWQPGEDDNRWNLNNGKVLDQGEALQIDLGINLIATQEVYESDSFGSDYDTSAKAEVFPEFVGGSSSTPVVPDGNNCTSEAITMTSGDVTAVVPAGVQLAPGTTQLTLTVTEMEATGSNVQLNAGEAMRSLDVHIEGIDPANTAPITVALTEVVAKGLNMGNYKLYHVENGTTNEMTLVDSAADFSAHNQFKYDPATGNITLYMASFSEVALVAEPAKWEGKFDYIWYDASKTELIIANADQLAAFGAIVGGMNGQTPDTFVGKTVKLISDINLGDKEKENNPDIIFYPIGYYNSEGTYDRTNTAITSGLRNFEGTFDGNGHTIANFYHNTWEMKGDHDWYSPEVQYYRDGMGLFGRVYKGTVKNLTVKNFSSDGEIATTGVIAAYADGATFENIAITNCNPRVYNIGNGGIVGCVGWYAKEANLKTTFKNITVDNSNKISALWGSYDVACGGIVGQYYPTSGQSSAGTPKNGGVHFENCHISAIMDVYNDVCANYQYYAYRYTGMLIGSVRENETINGHSYPKMDGITAKDCTVHFGTWNDYYYCEIIDNTTASYTHDYQMSRLTEIKAINGTTITYLDGTTGTVPASGRANYVIVDYTKGHGTENATCYHFKDGKVWNHEDGGKETINGVEVLKEDKQHIYLEFNNLVTGYGWGVTSKGVGDLAGVTILDREVGNSVVKFEGKVTELANNKEYKLGDIFSFVDKGVELKPGALTVAINNKAENNPVSATIVYDRENWENGTITLTGAGEITITIQDYYFCTPTTITVNVTEREAAEKFDIVMNNGDFLHRVGNKGTVPLDKLFKAKDGVTVGTVSVTIESVDGTGASGTYSNNAIQFSGTGVVKVTITDNDFCIPTELKLQVVDATNATSATSATANNVVLLNDCGFSSLEVSGGYTLYGNGFTMKCASDSAALNTGYEFVAVNNGTLDNVQIVCPNFDYAVLYASNMTESGNRKEETDRIRYFNVKSAVEVNGNSQILNSRISGGRAALNVVGGNVVVENSRIELGAVATVLVGAANSLALRNVTLVQKPTASTYDSSKTLMGFSVLFVCDANGDAAPVTLEGTLVQNAWVDENDKQYVPSAGESIISTVLGKTEYLHDLNNDGTKESLNLGFAYLPESLTSKVNTTTITDNRTNKNDVPYDYAEVSILNGKTYVYSYKNTTNNTADSFKTESDYEPNKYGDIITVSYFDAQEGLETSKSFSADGWTYELNVDLDKASGYKLDFSKLYMTVNGTAVTDYKVNGKAKPTSLVAVTAGGTTYTLTATVNGKEYTVSYKVTGTETSKDSPSLVGTPSYGAAFGVANSYGGDWSAAAPVLDGITVRYWSVADSDYKEFDLSSITFAKFGKQNGSNSYWEYIHTNNDFTLKLTNTAAIHDKSQTFGIPVAGTDGKLYFTIASSGGFVKPTTTSRSIAMQYEFTDNNGGEKLTFTHTFNINYNKDNQYSYSDLSGSGKLTKLEASSGGGDSCVTGDTLIAMADGTQKRAEDLVVGDMIMVFNHVTGKVEAMPLIFNTHSDENEAKNYDVLHLQFSNGKEVKIVESHGLFDMTLMQYVYIDYENYRDYIGHEFYAMNSDGTGENVKLVKAFIKNENVRIFCPVTYFHMNSFANGMLNTPNIPGDITGLVNYFEYDPDLKYNEESMQRDIEKYGLYSYADFSKYISEAAYNSSPSVYLKVAVGKGMITFEEILAVIEYLLAGSLIS